MQVSQIFLLNSTAIKGFKKSLIFFNYGLLHVMHSISQFMDSPQNVVLSQQKHTERNMIALFAHNIKSTFRKAVKINVPQYIKLESISLNSYQHRILFYQ